MLSFIPLAVCVSKIVKTMKIRRARPSLKVALTSYAWLGCALRSLRVFQSYMASSTPSWMMRRVCVLSHALENLRVSLGESLCVQQPQAAEKVSASAWRRRRVNCFPRSERSRFDALMYSLRGPSICFLLRCIFCIMFCNVVFRAPGSTRRNLSARTLLKLGPCSRSP